MKIRLEAVKMAHGIEIELDIGAEDGGKQSGRGGRSRCLFNENSDINKETPPCRGNHGVCSCQRFENIQYCAKRMQTNFSAFRNFSTNFNESLSEMKV